MIGQRRAGHPHGQDQPGPVRHRRVPARAPARWARARCRRPAAPSTSRRPRCSTRPARLAAHLLEARRRRHRGRRRRPAGRRRARPRTVSWAELAAASQRRGQAPRRHGARPLRHELDFDGTDSTFPFGAHVSVVEVDTETGQVTMLRHVAVDDCGRILNPLLVDGQQHGGIAQGAAQALYEQVQYDERRQPASPANLVDYAIPSAAELPARSRCPTPRPTARATRSGPRASASRARSAPRPAIQNAVIDAVSPSRRPPHRHAVHPRAGLARPSTRRQRIPRLPEDRRSPVPGPHRHLDPARRGRGRAGPGCYRFVSAPARG